MGNIFIGGDSLDFTQILLISLIALACVLAAVTIAFIVYALKVKKLRSSGVKADKIKIIDGVRYTKNTEIEDRAGNINVTYDKKDVVLQKGKTYIAKKDSDFMPGSYTVLSGSESEDKFNIRLDGYVREYKHGDAVVVAENAEVTSVSHSVVLR